jgi:uncharacterized protein
VFGHPLRETVLDLSRIRRGAFAALCLFMLTVAGHAQQAEPQKLEVEPLTIRTERGEFVFSAEIADEPREHGRGLMFREELAADEAMLFDFGSPRILTMWMKNTPLSLDMIFIAPDGAVHRIEERTTPFSEDVISSGEPVTHVLEVRGGVARMIGLKPGDRIEHRSFRR